MPVYRKFSYEDTQRVIAELDTESFIQNGLLCLSIYEVHQSFILLDRDTPEGEHYFNTVLESFSVMCYFLYGSAEDAAESLMKDLALVESKLTTRGLQ